MNTFFKKPWLIIIFIVAMTGFFSWQLPKIKINNEVEIFLPENHISRITKNRLEDIFGSTDAMAIGIKSKTSSIITIKNLELINKLIKDLEKINNVEDVTGLTNTDFIEGTAEGMKVGEIAKEIPKTETELNMVKEKLLSWKIYKGNLYSDDLKSTQILIKLKKGLSIEEKEKIYYDIKDVLNKYNNPTMDYYVAGTPVITVLLGEYMRQDMSRLIPFVVLVVVLSLYLSFKNLSGVLLPLITVLVSTIWTIGLMAMLNINLTMVSTVIPVLLVAVGSAYGIHIISHYYDDLKKEKSQLSEAKHRELVVETVHKVGKPVFLAGVTTIAGFASLATSSIVPIKHFGIFTAVGVLVALIVAVLLIPALLLVRHNSLKISDDDDVDDGLITKILIGFYHYFGRKIIRVLSLSLIIIVISIIGMSKIIVDGPLIEMFKPSSEIRVSDKYLSSTFNGTTVLDILIEGKNKGDLTNPEILKEMDNLKKFLKYNYSKVGEVTSFADFLKRMNQVMNYPQEDEEIISDSTSDSDLDVGFVDDGFSNDSFTEDNSFGDDSFTDNSQSEKTTTTIENKTPKIKTANDVIKVINNAILHSDKLNLTAEELVEVINKELNYKGASYNEIPYNPKKYMAANRDELKNLISQYLLLYSGSLDDYINDQLEPSKARMIIQLKTGSNIYTKKVEKAIKDYAAANFPKGYTINVAGHADMSSAVNDLIVSSQIMSIISSLIIVFIIVAFSYKSIIAGIYGIIPLTLSLLINFGLMGYFGIKLDLGTAMVASIAIGIGVDYTIHFLSTYNYERKRSDDLEIVTKNTLITSGKAIIFNAISVAGGFAVLLFSNFVPLVNLGLLISLTMITSSAASMTVLPALLNLFKPKFISK
ncbi:hypothetical protein EV215_0442 [Hypnocyclicus thermotrophus]|uniref:SSD domain-containing protein n=1 Tax=Hypnocyclicus thermotrophus TaxID=1627895 RepID=A0AA46I5Y6_9FUSO|nr:MMPL family transporter [Hypnocyclicus thermotrophus]TDT71758.1 hypothetical protein EV215_0442 [Hypnocyclicus thermotrophus]